MSELTTKVGADDHVQGSLSAPVTLVEYGDYQCPSCGQAYPIVKQLQSHFGEKLLFCFRNFPLEQHEFAETAAETAEWAGSQGKFWEMHDLLYKNQRSFAPDVFAQLAKEVGLPAEQLQGALEKQTFADRVEQDLNSGEESGVAGTPTFFLNGRQHRGSYDYDSMLEAVERLLRG